MKILNLLTYLLNPKPFYTRVVETKFADGGSTYKPEVKWSRFGRWGVLSEYDARYEYNSLERALLRIDVFIQEWEGKHINNSSEIVGKYAINYPDVLKEGYED